MLWLFLSCAVIFIVACIVGYWSGSKKTAATRGMNSTTEQTRSLEEHFEKYGKILVKDMKDKLYVIETHHTKEETTEWFQQYAERAKKSRCESCGRIIFPKEPVGRNGRGLMHLRPYCCETGGLFVGYLDADGKLIPTYEGGVNTMMHVFKTGEVVVNNFKLPTLETAEYLDITPFELL